MTGFLGMVPAEVEALAASMRQKADDVDALIRTIGARLDGTSWFGGDRDAFEGRWSGELAAGLRQVAETLRDAAEVATANARQQRDVSGS